MLRRTFLGLISLKKASSVPEAIPPPEASRFRRPVPLWRKRERRPADVRMPYIIRSFIKDRYTSDIQHIENRGMYAEEIDIERSRFPNFNKTLTIATDGSLAEREFEYAVPPLLPLFQDRQYAHRQRLSHLAKVGRLGKVKHWEKEQPPPRSDLDMVNALAFPYCVPRRMAMRSPVEDPLSTKGGRRTTEDAE